MYDTCINVFDLLSGIQGSQHRKKKNLNQLLMNRNLDKAVIYYVLDIADPPLCQYLLLIL